MSDELPPYPRPRARDDERGTSLVELLMGTVVMVVGLLGIANVCTRVATLRKTDAEVVLALAACRDTLEECRALPLASLPALDGADFDVPGPAGQPLGLRAVPGDADGLAGEIEVTVDRSSPAQTLYRVRATVIWSGVAQRSQFALESLIGARP